MAEKTTALARANDGQPSAVEIIAEMSRNPECDPEKFRAMLEVQKDWEANEARKAFAQALADFQRQAPIIEPKDRANGRPYARMDRIWRAVRPLLDSCGLSVSWQGCALADGLLRLSGTLMHVLGHSTPIAYDLPVPEAIKGQNAAQAMGSATTYAKRYAMCAALGIQTGDDDDGERAGIGDAVSASQAKELSELCDQAGGTAKADMLRFARVDAIAEVPAGVFGQCVTALRKRIKAAEADQEDLPI